MILKQQVTSLELSKRLKELGVKQESLFYWKRYYHPDKSMFVDFLDQKIDDGWTKTKGEFVVSAFTTAELGEMLPWELKQGAYRYELEIAKNGKGFECYYFDHDFDNTLGLKIYEEPNEANARAKMLTYLLENRLISL